MRTAAAGIAHWVKPMGEAMSITSTLRSLLAVLAALACFGCSNGATVLQAQKLGKDETLVTSADLRTITRTEVAENSDFGRVKPTAVTCAEPSPDVAKAVAESFQLDSEVAAEVSGQGGGSLALAMARERAEAIAQMTERLATIQLLRDGMYRACEAYANGALSKTEYAVILSRYDDTMVTLLLGELVAGNFGRPLVRLGSAASARLGEAEQGAGSAQGVAKAAEDQIAAKQAELAELDQDVSEKEKALQAAPEASKPRLESELAALRVRRDVAFEEIGRLKLLNAMASSAAAGGGAMAASFERGGASLAFRDTKVAATLEQMQKNYLHDINSDAVETACLSVLSETPEAARPVLVAHCVDNVLPGLHEARSRLLDGLIARSAAWSDIKAIENAVKRASAVEKALEARAGREAETAVTRRDLLVKSVQRMLRDAGFKVGPVDGVIGPKTVSAIKDFEIRHPETPRFDDDPWAFAIGVRKIIGE